MGIRGGRSFDRERYRDNYRENKRDGIRAVIKDESNIVSIVLEILSDKRLFKDAYEKADRSGRGVNGLSEKDLFLDVIGNPVINALFDKLRTRKDIELAIDELRNGVDTSSQQSRRLNDRSIDEDTKRILDEFVDYVYQTSNKNIDLYKNKNTNKAVFIKALAKFFLSEDGKALISRYKAEKYEFNTVWNAYNKLV